MIEADEIDSDHIEWIRRARVRGRKTGGELCTLVFLNIVKPYINTGTKRKDHYSNHRRMLAL